MELITYYTIHRRLEYSPTLWILHNQLYYNLYDGSHLIYTYTRLIV